MLGEAREAAGPEVEVCIVSLHQSPELPSADGHVAVGGAVALGADGDELSLRERLRAARVRGGRRVDRGLDRVGVTALRAEIVGQFGREGAGRPRPLPVDNALAARFWGAVHHSARAMKLLASADAIAAQEAAAVYAAWQIAQMRPDVIATMGIGAAALELEARREALA